MSNLENLQNWVQKLEHFDIPTWEELPRLDLYMDQVITLMDTYLSAYQKPGDKLLTPSMINNYVKLGVIPKPFKKRYNHVHLAYLTMVCSLKQVLSISIIQKILPITLTENDIKNAFTAFREAQKQIFSRVTENVTSAQKSLQEKENATFADFFGETVQVALRSNIYKILSEIIADS